MWPRVSLNKWSWPISPNWFIPTKLQEISWATHLWEHILSQKTVFKEGRRKYKWNFVRPPNQKVQIQNELDMPHVHQTSISAFEWNLPQPPNFVSCSTSPKSDRVGHVPWQSWWKVIQLGFPFSTKCFHSQLLSAHVNKKSCLKIVYMC